MVTESSWLDKPKYRNVKRTQESVVSSKAWVKCNACQREEAISDLAKNLYVCQQCNFHFPIDHRKRIQLLLDPNSFNEKFHKIKSIDPLNFTDGKTSYKEKFSKAVESTKINESVIVGEGAIDQKKVAFGVMEFQFIGGSMGAATGHKIFSIMQYAVEKNLPLIMVASSGGARMQEGLLSLIQMAKTSLGANLISEKKLPFFSILTHPTTGGVTASFASLGDLIIAEPGAMIAFSGRRVIEEIGGEKLPQNFQTAEFLLECGFVDCIVHRSQLKKQLSMLLDFFQN